MKKLLVFFSIFCLSAAVYAQSDTKAYAIAASVGTGFSLGKPSVTPFTFRASGYYTLHPRWETGGGMGYSLYDRISLVPLYGLVNFRLTRPLKVTPYVTCAAGYAFAPAHEATGGFYLSPSVGIRFVFAREWRMLAAVGYELQALSRVRQYAGTYFTTAYQEQLSYRSLTFRLGVLF